MDTAGLIHLFECVQQRDHRLPVGVDVVPDPVRVEELRGDGRVHPRAGVRPGVPAWAAKDGFRAKEGFCSPCWCNPPWVVLIAAQANNGPMGMESSKGLSPD